MKGKLLIAGLLALMIIMGGLDAGATGNTIVRMETSAGPIRIMLYDDTPAHRDNFIKLAKEGYYDGMSFHRIIKDFMIQAGDPGSRKADAANLGEGDPGYTIPAEIVYPEHFHKYGAVAAARTADAVNPERRSSGSQFYIVTGNKYTPAELAGMGERTVMKQRQAKFRELCEVNRTEIDSLQKAADRDGLEALRQKLIKETEEAVPVTPLPEEIAKTYETVGGTPHLDGQYTVFGEVIEGMDAVEKLQNVATGAMDRPVNADECRILNVTVE